METRRRQDGPLDDAPPIHLETPNDHLADALWWQTTGRKVELTGSVRKIEPDFDDYVDLQLSTVLDRDPLYKADAPGEAEYYFVTCKLITAQNAKARELKVGDRVTVVGIARVVWPVLGGCFIKAR